MIKEVIGEVYFVSLFQDVEEVIEVVVKVVEQIVEFGDEIVVFFLECFVEWIQVWVDELVVMVNVEFGLLVLLWLVDIELLRIIDQLGQVVVVVWGRLWTMLTIDIVLNIRLFFWVVGWGCGCIWFE